MLDWKSAAVAVLNPLLLPLHYRSSGGVWCRKVGQYRYGRPTRNDNKLLWKKDAICMALMSLQGPFEKPSNHNLNNTVQFCLQPFSLLLKWRWKPTGEEIKSLKKTSKTAKLRWETGLVDIDSNSLCTLRLLHVFAIPVCHPSAGLEWPPAFRKGQH